MFDENAALGILTRLYTELKQARSET